MKQKKIAMLLIAIIVVILLTFSVIYFVGINQKKKEEKEITFDFKDRKLNICKTDNCPTLKSVNYRQIIADTENSELLEIVEKVNSNTERYYEEAKQTNMSDSSCSSVRDLYYHSESVIPDIFAYADKDVFGLSVLRNHINFCTQKSEFLPFETYTYDLKEKRLLNQEEIYKKNQLKDEDIRYVIQNELDRENELKKTNMTLEETYKDGKLDYTLFFNRVGDLSLLFQHYPTKTYYIAIAKLKKN